MLDSVRGLFGKRTEEDVAAPVDTLGIHPDELTINHDKVSTAVREILRALGVVPGTYKFKVLRLDLVGSLYIIMMDVSSTFRISHSMGAKTFSDIERMIREHLFDKDNIILRALYWRNNSEAMFERTQVARKPIPKPAPLLPVPLPDPGKF